MKQEYILNLEQLDTLIKDLVDFLSYKNCIVILRGDLASGKTTLVKNFVKTLGLDDIVTSPTFSIQSIYSDEIFHYDIYNKTLEEFISLGLLEEFEKSGIHFVEWGDENLEKLLLEYGYEVYNINIEKLEDKRCYKIDT